MDEKEVKKIVDNIPIDNHELINPENILQTKFDQQVIKPKKKTGPRSNRYSPKVLDKIRTLCENGAIYDIQIYPALGIAYQTFYDWKRQHPEINDTIHQAQNNYLQKVLVLHNDILFNPSHKEHGKFITKILDRLQQREIANQKQLLEVNHTFNPADEISDDKLLEHLNEDIKDE